MNNSIINNFVDSFIAFLFAISGPVAIMLSITSTNNVDPRDVSIWLFGCFAVNGFFSIILTFKNKQPLVLMWSIPGMILIGYSLKNIFIIDGSKRSTKANAFFSGLGPKKNNCSI